ncbi:MAG: hypothetical protein J6I60_06480 [Bacteroidaceae bacterium]|nr:hypothetical protein [Bacteroidaceae bacterium]
MKDSKKKKYILPFLKVLALKAESAFALSMPIDPDDPPVDPGTAEIPDAPQWNKEHDLWEEDEVEDNE